MASFINHNSFVLLALTLWGGLAALLLRDGVSRRDVLALGILGAGLIVAWLALRPGPGTFTDAAQAEAATSQGQPVLVEFYSNY